LPNINGFPFAPAFLPFGVANPRLDCFAFRDFQADATLRRSTGGPRPCG
jgi:hypothetical protein